MISVKAGVSAIVDVGEAAQGARARVGMHAIVCDIVFVHRPCRDGGHDEQRTSRDATRQRGHGKKVTRASDALDASSAHI